jgi:hypothetical protein
MMDYGVVTAADAGYYSLLQGLLASLGPLGRIPIYILDLGLNDRQRQELHDLGVTTTVPGWDVAIASKRILDRHGHRVPMRDTFRAFTAQPFLPKYAPGHDILFWIDADCWVQDLSAIDLYLDAASDGTLAITLEVDRCYGAPYWRLKSHFRDFIRAFGLKDGYKLARTMTANVGVFALKSNAPHWGLWQRATRRAMMHPHQRSQQMAMQYVIYIDEAPSAFLPAYCNWQSWEAVAQFDEHSNMLVEPQPPYRPIGVMHNAQEDKSLIFSVRTRQGHLRSATMRYEDWNHRQTESVA